jgi:hypothetical protein
MPVGLSLADFPNLELKKFDVYGSWIPDVTTVVTTVGVTLTYKPQAGVFDMYFGSDCVAVLNGSGVDSDTVLNTKGDMTLNMPADTAHVVGYRIDRSAFFLLKAGGLAQYS